MKNNEDKMSDNSMSYEISPDLQQIIDDDALMVCIDVECHCQNQSYQQWKKHGKSKTRRITEIGVCILDPRNITAHVAYDPTLGTGDRGVLLGQYIVPWQLALKDWPHNPSSGGCNKAFCRGGTADNFVFGPVDWLWKSELEEGIFKILEQNVKSNRDYRSITRIVKTHDTSNFQLRTCSSDNEEDNIKDAGMLQDDLIDKSTIAKHQQYLRPHRKVAFLFFDKRNDLIWLKEHDVDLLAMFPNCRVVDIQQSKAARTIAMHLGHSRLGATNLFHYMGIPIHCQHNGGNDAVFELQA